MNEAKDCVRPRSPWLLACLGLCLCCFELGCSSLGWVALGRDMAAVCPSVGPRTGRRLPRTIRTRRRCGRISVWTPNRRTTKKPAAAAGERGQRFAEPGASETRVRVAIAGADESGALETRRRAGRAGDAGRARAAAGRFAGLAARDVKARLRAAGLAYRGERRRASPRASGRRSC